MRKGLHKHKNKVILTMPRQTRPCVYGDRMNLIPLEELRRLVQYDDRTGNFIRTSTAGRLKAGSLCGSTSKDGYVYVMVQGQKYKAHRLAWFYVHGEWPKYDIDHINGLRNDNRIVNLRDVETSRNLQNSIKPARAKTASGLRGVSWHKKTKKWVANIKLNIYFSKKKIPRRANTEYP